MPVDLVPGETPLPDLLSGDRDIISPTTVSSYKGTNPIYGDSTLMTQLLPKVPNTFTLRARASIYEWGGWDTNMQSTAAALEEVDTKEMGTPRKECSRETDVFCCEKSDPSLKILKNMEFYIHSTQLISSLHSTLLFRTDVLTYMYKILTVNIDSSA